MTLSESPSQGRLAGRIAIISGGASGCGEAASRLFAAEGATVAIIDRQGDLAESVAASIVASDPQTTDRSSHWYMRQPTESGASVSAAILAASSEMDRALGAFT